jgi:transketolase
MSATMNDFDFKASRKRCLEYRKRILEISQKVTALHIASAYSCMEIVDTIYNGLMRIEGKKTLDTFIMSKGHGCLAQYVSLERLGILSTRDIELYCKPEGILGTHPDYGVPGIEAATGSLGHGMGIALGMAYADKIDHTDRKTYVVLSDGELNEGSTWEAMMLAPSLGVKNLIAFVDNNDFQSLGRTSETLPNFYPVIEKAEAFGWQAIETKGHSAEALFAAARSHKGDKPLLVNCKTTKGRGVSYMENVPIWHYRSPSPDEYQKALSELKEVFE